MGPQDRPPALVLAGHPLRPFSTSSCPFQSSGKVELRQRAETVYMWGQRDGEEVVCPGFMSQVLDRGAVVDETAIASRIVCPFVLSLC